MQSSLPAGNLTAETAGAATDPALDHDLRHGVLHTEVARPVAWALVGSFLLAIYSLPLSQLYFEWRAEEESPLVDLLRRAPSAESSRQMEHDLEQASYAKSFVQPLLQLILTSFGRVGNERAVVGQRGWLYYTPGVLHVAGPGFLKRDFQRERELGERDADNAPIHADPRPAILDFNAALARRGIRLVLMPVPDKAAVEAESLHARGRPSRLPENADFDRFLTELRAEGVAVFDARAVLPSAEQSSAEQSSAEQSSPGQSSPQRPAFLVQDTHWTPAWMEHVARALGAYVNELGALGAAPEPTLHAVEQSAERVGDLVDMLKLPEDQRVFLPQAVRIHPVLDAQGNAWEPDPDAEILLLGDSFSNVFSLEGMGWGAAAGLGPQLALALGRPLDVIARNDSGAFVTRRALAREIAAGNDRLAGKRVVIWEFAARELSAGDWKRIELPEAPATGSP
jgi:SGNH hydrolase-like domain, acetyltransferase AlgX